MSGAFARVPTSSSDRNSVCVCVADSRSHLLFFSLCNIYKPDVVFLTDAGTTYALDCFTRYSRGCCGISAVRCLYA